VKRFALVGNRDGRVIVHWARLPVLIVATGILVILLETAWVWVLSRFGRDLGPETLQHKLWMALSMSVVAVTAIAWAEWRTEQARISSTRR